MAHIPYGYRIEGGKAVIETEKAEQVRKFFESYLSGLSIENAAKEAGLPVSTRTANDMLKRETYLGDDYYPVIIDAEVFHAAALERQKRFEHLGSHRTSEAKAAIPVRERFKIQVPGGDGVPDHKHTAFPDHASERSEKKFCDQPEEKGLTPAKKAAFLYRCITPSDDGQAVISSGDRSKLTSLLQ